MKITISGNPGSGKTTVRDIIAKKLALSVFSTGMHMREMAEKRNMSLLELSKVANEDKSIDKELDDWQTNLGKNNDNFILDARLGFHFVPDSIKIFLKVDLEEGARRIFNHNAEQRKKEADNTTLEKTIENIKKRRESENLRYKKLYGINQDDESNFDLIIDTTNIPAEEVAKKVIEFIQKSSKS